MSIRHLSRMMQPASVALAAGLSGPSNLGVAVARNIRECGFKGALFTVGALWGHIEGATQVASVSHLPAPADLSIVVSDPGSLVELISDLGRLGSKVAVVLTGRPAGGGEPVSHSLHQDVREVARLHGLRLLGLNSLGVLVPGASLNAGVAHIQPLKGNLAFVAQSGAVMSAVLDWATTRNIGFSALMALGTMIDVDFGDALDLLSADLNTQAILLCTEGITGVRKFMSAARQAARMKPVIVLKSARFPECVRDSASQRAHELGLDEVYDAAFRRAGLLRVSDIQELFDAAETLARARAVPGTRLGILSNGGGIGILAADRLRASGGQLPRLSAETFERLSSLLPAWCPINMPLDIQIDASGELYADALEALLEDEGVDAVLVLNAPSALASNVEAARSVAEVARKRGARPRTNRLLTCWLGDGTAEKARQVLTEASVPTYETPEAAVRGYLEVCQYQRNQEMLMETVSSLPEAFHPDTSAARRLVRGAIDAGRGALFPEEVEAVLGAYGIPVDAPAAKSPAHELLISVFVDVQFGPVVAFGRGGRAPEHIKDKTHGLPPLNMNLAREMMSRTRIFQVLEGEGGMPRSVLDRAALVLVKVSQLICDIPEIEELEINPLAVDEGGVMALGARCRVAATSVSGLDRMAIRPYPKELEETITIPDGQTLLLRPIRPEDEPAYHRLFAGLPAEDVFMRFMNPMKVLPHGLAARLTQIDYDREMALVLAGETSTGEVELYGGVRISADPDNERAEFAILLRRDMTGLGLGPMMMRRIIDYARGRGLREIYGEVLSENAPMLKLCRVLGFSIRRMPDDPSVMLATLKL